MSRPCRAFLAVSRTTGARLRRAGIPHAAARFVTDAVFACRSGKPRVRSFECSFTLTRFEFEHRMFENDQSSDNVAFDYSRMFERTRPFRPGLRQIGS
ncbi:hypothetical protein Bamb_3567 [Burkholderia ambifaria AMMD]|uniref:Uncharacterized protein n=1 Tax=Burkholderia ambifaria (strain ATCC BAA-244 / DSM 16087 / CCUG 44356 / LMG 19182 / AMMD) TaxID=339670 RepID=Q0B9Q2_BURCM|nr:hypothetical protein Bamb_3567 [Burkholderia ambifaria AMMD]